MTRVALVSMPWRRPNNAAIGLALLKSAALKAGASKCDVYYLNDRWFNFVFDHGDLSETLRSLKFSEFARVISELAGVIQAGEWVFAQALFGHRVPNKARYLTLFEQGVRGNPYAQFAAELVSTSDLVEGYFADCEQAVDWMAYDTIGFSCVFYQLIPSLSFANRLRRKGFKGRIVFGGPLCEGVVGGKLLELFPFIDAVFDGEADESFRSYIVAAKDEGPVSAVGGLWSRDEQGRSRKTVATSGVQDMNALPLPEYSDFFEELARSGRVTTDEIAFPIEGSRGCWWGERHHCIFCGLNGADMTHRMKSADRIYTEIAQLHSDHGLKHFAFTDNIVSPKFTKPLMELLKNDPLPVTFHAEIKSNLSRRQIQDYREAGFIYLQPGIESLSSNVLKIMDKGVSALHNIACLKFCQESKIVAFWNLLYGFPGETEDDYRQILEFLPYIVHLNPPEVVNAMRLTRFSPSFDRSKALGFHNRRPARFCRFFFPFDDADLNDLVNTFEFDFADAVDRKRYVAEIESFVNRWKAEPRTGTLVYDPDGFSPDQPALLDTRFTRKKDHRLLNSVEAWVYRLCDKPMSMTSILEKFEESSLARHWRPGDVVEALESFISDRFSLREDHIYLSLAMMESRFVPWQALAALEQMVNPEAVMSHELEEALL